jgi:hypothetical protein
MVLHRPIECTALSVEVIHLSNWRWRNENKLLGESWANKKEFGCFLVLPVMSPLNYSEAD